MQAPVSKQRLANKCKNAGYWAKASSDIDNILSMLLFRDSPRSHHSKGFGIKIHGCDEVQC